MVLLTFLLGGCGPTEREAGTAVLCAAPLALAAGLLSLWPLLLLWRRRYPELSFRLLPSLCLFVCLANGAVFRAVFDFPSTEWTWVALWWFGTSYVALLLLVWRFCFELDRRHSFTWSPIPVMVLYVAPAIYLAFEGSATASAPGWIIDFWSLPGLFGWVPGGLLVLLLIEAVLRTRRRPIDPSPNPLVEEGPPG